MKKLFCLLVISYLSACSNEQYETAYREPVSSSAVRGSYLAATGTLNSLGGLIETNGYLRINAIDGQNVDDEGDFISLMSFSSDDSDFKPVRVLPGLRKIDVLIKFGSWRHINTFNLNVKPNTQYVFKGQNQGYGGHFWVEDSSGAKSKPMSFNVRQN